MEFMLRVLLFAAAGILAEGKPQDVIFPDNEGPPDNMPGRPIPVTPPAQTESTTSASTDTTRSTRIPPRDPGNRIVYLVSCPCLFTYEYSPVCGTDGQTYGNMGVLNCARQCGKKVDVYLVGACGSNNG